MGLLFELVKEEKNVCEAGKHLGALCKEVSKLKDEIKKVQGPLEFKASFAVQWKLGFKRELPTKSC